MFEFLDKIGAGFIVVYTILGIIVIVVLAMIHNNGWRHTWEGFMGKKRF